MYTPLSSIDRFEARPAMSSLDGLIIDETDKQNAHIAYTLRLCCFMVFCTSNDVLNSLWARQRVEIEADVRTSEEFFRGFNAEKRAGFSLTLYTLVVISRRVSSSFFFF